MPDTEPKTIHPNKETKEFAFATAANLAVLDERIVVLEENTAGIDDDLDEIDGALQELFAYMEEDAPRIVQSAAIISACFVSAFLIAFGAVIGLLLRRD